MTRKDRRRSSGGSSSAAIDFLNRRFPFFGVALSLGLVFSGSLRGLATRPLAAWLLLGAVIATCAVAAKMRLADSGKGKAPVHGESLLAALALSTAMAVAVPLGRGFFPFVCAAAVLTSLSFRGWTLRLLTGLLVLFCIGDGLHAEGEGMALTLGLQSIGVVLFACIPAMARRLPLHGAEDAVPALSRAAPSTSLPPQPEDEALDAKVKGCRLMDMGPERGTSGGEALSGFDLDGWLSSSIEALEGAVGASLQVAETALSAHACMAFLLDAEGRTLFVSEYRASSGTPRLDPIPAGEGVLGAAMGKRSGIRLDASGLSSVNYYSGAAPALSGVLAVPMVEPGEGGKVRGVLVADRADDPRSFGDKDERILKAIADEVLRAVDRERLLTWFKRSHDKTERLYQSIARLNRTSKRADALEAALTEATQLAKLDFATITLVHEGDSGKKSHLVACASDKGLEGYEFPDNAGLVSSVVRLGTPLPERDVSRMDKVVLFDSPVSADVMGALKILPLTAGDRIVGTLVAGRSRGCDAFDEETLRTLEVLSMQAAQSFQRADLFDRMEQLATIDGLTGLVNHRTFQSRCDEALQLAQRYGKKMSLMLTDIDHFKRVNDTYGHPTGDLVLKGVARILKDGARGTDVVARYGGEEFIVIMPETDAQGAKAIAERIRKRIEAETFQTEQGPLKVTMSLGIATYPDSAAKKQDLIDLSDQCLYFAKEHGRNQSVTVAEMQAGANLPKVES